MEDRRLMNKRELVEKAAASEYGESYLMLEKGKGYRAGVGARVQPSATTFFLEIDLNLSSGSPSVDIANLEKELELMRRLEGRGYALTFDDTLGISCEIIVNPKELDSEYNEVVTILRKAMQ